MAIQILQVSKQLAPRLLAQNTKLISVVKAKSSIADNADMLIKDPAETSTGLERQELLLRLAGIENPYYCFGFHERKDFNEVPIPHSCGKRVISCMCEEDSQGINYMWLYRGPAQRCKCGYWFKLVDARPI